MVRLLYSGVDLARSNKVHPEPKIEKDAGSEEDLKFRKANKNSRTGGDSKGSYF